MAAVGRNLSKLLPEKRMSSRWRVSRTSVTAVFFFFAGSEQLGFCSDALHSAIAL